MTTYTKLRDGSWGLRGSATDLQPGMPVRVEKRDGSIREEIIGAVLWTGEDVASNRISLARIASSAPRTRRERGTWTGCSCGSIEEYERDGDCASCQFDR